MNELRTNPSASTPAGFRWPTRAECAVIAANVLLPYVLALILLAA